MTTFPSKIIQKGLATLNAQTYSYVMHLTDTKGNIMEATNKFEAMGKEELRAACREAGISYGKLNNAGMREALVAHYAEAEALVEMEHELDVAQNPDAPEVQAEAPAEEAPAAPTGLAAQLLGLAPAAVAPVANGNVTRVVDGKKVEPRQPGKRNMDSEAPKVKRVSTESRKGYKIEKEREERVVDGKVLRRPSEGTICASIWDTFDADRSIRAADLGTLAETNGWDRTTIAVQFYAWRKFNGIKGRQAK